MRCKQKVIYYIGLYSLYMKINIKSVMIYDLDFLFGILATAVRSAVNFLTLLIVFSIVDEIEGWSFYQILFFYSVSTVGYALWHCFFSDILTIPYYVRTGEFDRFLLKPIRPLFQIMMDTLDEDGWGELIWGGTILGVSIWKLEIFSYKLLFLPLLLFVSTLIFASISIVLSSIAFLTKGGADLVELGTDLQEFSKYPITIYQKGVRIIFTFLIPIGFAVYYPGLWYLNKTRGLGLFCTSICAGVLFFAIAVKLWYTAMKSYTSSGS